MIPAARAVLLTAALTHVVHDGFSDALYVLLPIWAGEFRLTLTQVGVLKAVYTGGMAASQMPAGLLAERWGERQLLAAGTAVAALGYLAVATSATGMLPLVGLLLVSGLGSGVQHPLSSSLVAHAYETGPRRAALGTYNFAGDIGKIAVPAAVALAATFVGWRAATGVYALLGLASAAVIAVVLAWLKAGGTAVHAEGAPVAAGRLGDPRRARIPGAVRGRDDRHGDAHGAPHLPPLPPAREGGDGGRGRRRARRPLRGRGGGQVRLRPRRRAGRDRAHRRPHRAGDGARHRRRRAGLPVRSRSPCSSRSGSRSTGRRPPSTRRWRISSLPERRARAYGLYYTLVVAASAAAPLVYGVLGDAIGVLATLLVTSAVVLLTLPLCSVLRTALAQPAGDPDPRIALPEVTTP